MTAGAKGAMPEGGLAITAHNRAFTLLQLH